MDSNAKNDGVPGVRQIAGAVAYADGAEDAVFQTLARAADRRTGSDELASAIIDWPTRYHFSRQRANLLRPLMLQSGMRALDVGAGSGVLSRFLGEAGLEVVALEGTLARARSAAVRCEGLPNVHVVSGDIEAFDDPSGFDIVTCVGVLEHVPAARRGPFLRRLRALTRPTGVLVLAIENQLGLKYLLGYAEDHAGEPWLGVEGYPGPASVRTFCRATLTRMLADTGFGAQRWMFPFPDYKLPAVVIDDGAYSRADAETLVDQLVGWPCTSDASPPARTCDDRRAHRVFLEAGLGTQVANSFMVIAAAHPDLLAAVCEAEAIAWHWGSDRLRPWLTCRVVRKTAGGLVVSSSRVADDRMPERQWLSQCRVADEPYLEGPTLERLALDACADGGADLGRVLTRWRRHLLGIELREKVHPPVAHPFCGDWTKHWIPADHLDVNLSNFIARPDGTCVNIDKEWFVTGPVDADLVCARALWHFAANLVLRGTGHPWPAESTVDELACRLGGLCEVPVSEALLSRWRRAEGELQSLIHGGSSDGARLHLEIVGRLSLRSPEIMRQLPFRRLLLESARLRASLSWRITRPLRRIGRMVARLRG
jgi:O-antigen biosynthesis protein